VALARAGCDIIAPSGMMDGMVGAIRKALDENGQSLLGGDPSGGPARSHRGEPTALETVGTLGHQNPFALAFRVNNMKTAAGRTMKIAALVALLARGARRAAATATRAPPARRSARGCGRRG
jgi:Delta-aminolevulinic acid dehydratase